MEIKNKLTVTRGEGGGRVWGKEGKGSSKGTHIKDTWTKPKRVRSRVGGGNGWCGGDLGEMEITVLEQQ